MGQESDPSFLLSFSAPLIFVRNNMQLLQEILSFANVQEVKALSGDLFNHKCSTVFSLTERKKSFGLHRCFDCATILNSHLLMHANAF